MVSPPVAAKETASPVEEAFSSLIDVLTIDRRSPVPLYFQVAQQLERAIEEGRMPPGTRLDNEVQLAEQLGMSRPTLRRAMQHLVDKGLVVRRRGVGTRVVQPKVRRSLELSSLYDDLAATDRRPSTRVLDLAVGPSTPDESGELGVAEESPVLRLTRLRAALDQPIAHMTNVLPADLLPDVSAEALERHGLYQLLRTAGVQLHAARQTIGARKATAEESRLLGESRGAALLTMQRLSYDDHGRAVELGRHVYAATRYSFELSLLTS